MKSIPIIVCTYGNNCTIRDYLWVKCVLKMVQFRESTLFASKAKFGDILKNYCAFVFDVTVPDLKISKIFICIQAFCKLAGGLN